MSIMITGASGQLGSLVVERLLSAGVPAGGLVATGRDVSRLEPLAARGVRTMSLDLADEELLRTALLGVDRLLLVSTTTVGERFAHHRRAIDAARASGVGRLVYTSTVNADTARMRLADEHRRTEEHLRESGVPFTILRNGWYLENYTSQLPAIREQGTLWGAAADGRVSGAARSDLAEAAAAVLTGDGHEGRTYELGGEAFTLTQLAATMSEQLGTPVTYRDLPVDEYAAALAHAGLPAELAEVLADADAGLARGELHTASDDLARLIGRAPTTPAQAIRAALGQG